MPKFKFRISSADGLYEMEADVVHKTVGQARDLLHEQLTQQSLAPYLTHCFSPSLSIRVDVLKLDKENIQLVEEEADDEVARAFSRRIELRRQYELSFMSVFGVMLSSFWDSKTQTFQLNDFLSQVYTANEAKAVQLDPAQLGPLTRRRFGDMGAEILAELNVCVPENVPQPEGSNG